MVPLLVRAQTEDADGGEAYTRRLLTLTGVALLLATAARHARRPAAHPPLPRRPVGHRQPRAGHRAGLPAAAADLLLRHRRPARRDPQQPRLVRRVRLGTRAQQRRRARRARGLRADARRDQPRPGAHGRAEAAGAGLGTTLGIVVQALVLLPGDPPRRLPLPPAAGAGTRACSAAGGLVAVGGRLRADRQARLHRHHPRRRRGRPPAASPSTPTPGCCCRCPTACSASRCSPR